MKNSHVIVAGAVAVIVGGVAVAFLQEAEPGQAADAMASAPALLSAGKGESQPAYASGEAISQTVHVDELAANPEGYNGRVLIRGIVAGVNQKEGVVALIDSREFESCGTVACATNYLPVRVNGTLPKALSLVQVVGEVTSGANGLEVRAESVEIVK